MHFTESSAKPGTLVEQGLDQTAFLQVVKHEVHHTAFLAEADTI